MNPFLAQSSATLRLTGDPAHLVELTLVSNSGEPDWEPTVAQAVQWALGGRPVVAVLPDPPTWEVEPRDLPAQIQRFTWEKNKFIFASDPAAPAQFLQALTATTDFRLQALWLWVGTLESVAKLTPFLSILQVPYTAAPTVPDEFIECIGDGEVLSWYHPDPQALQQWVTRLPAWAEQHGWAFAQQLP